MAPANRETGVNPTAEAWEARRLQCEQLYVTEDKTLTEVKSILEGDGFKATHKMYKYRFAKWGFKTHKKLNAHDAKAYLESHEAQKHVLSRLHPGGRALDMDRVLKYYKRKKVTVRDVTRSVLSSAPNSDDSSHQSSGSANSSPDILPEELHTVHQAEETEPLSCFDPTVIVSVSLPGRIASPDTLKSAEYYFADITEYYYRSLGEGVWRPDGEERKCVNTRTVRPGVSVGDFYQKVNLAATLFDSLQLTMAEKSFSDACAQMPILVEKQASDTIPDILRLLAGLLGKGKYHMVLRLCKKLSLTEGAIGSENDVLTSTFRNIFARLEGLIRDDRSGQVLSNGICAIMNTFDHTLGICHMETISATRDFVSIVRDMTGSDNIVKLLVDAYKSCVLQTGRGSLQSVTLLFEVARIEFHAKNYAEAAQHVEEGIKYAEGLLEVGNETTVPLLLDACWISGQAHDKLGSSRTVEARYRQAVRLNACKYGLENWSTKRDRTVLWRWLMDQGRSNDAALVRAEGPIML